VTRIAIVMPKSGAGMESGVIVTWRKAPGEAVARGEPIVEIETDKTTLEMEAATSGVLVEIVHEGGSEVPVGEPIGWLEDGQPSGGPNA
jgi:pyruvate dehydrogenase E2 component (dihydrolipoamide acetyltransferase)